MKVVSKLSYYNLLTIALKASVNMTLKLLILNYCNDIFIAIKYHFEIFVAINCKNSCVRTGFDSNPKTGIDSSPISPNNKFVEGGRKN